MSTRKLGVYASKEAFLENEIRTLNHHIVSMIDTMKVMSMNRQATSDEVERLKQEILDEREACAKVCDDRAFQFFSESPFFVEMHGLADAIRARSNT